MSGKSDGPTLVVDFGTSALRAAVLAGGESWLVPEPASGSYSWPCAAYWDGDRLVVGTLAERQRRTDPDGYWSEFKRALTVNASIAQGNRRFRAVDQVTAMLAAVREVAQQRLGRPVERALVTVPAGYLAGDTRRDRMVGAAEQAGFATVEVLAEPVAAAAGPAFDPGALVLVYDLGGGSFDAALVRTGARPALLGWADVDDGAGRDMDALLAARIHADGAAWLAPLLASVAENPTDAAALRLGTAITDFAQRIRHQLSVAEVVEERLLPGAPVYRLTADDLAELVAPLLARTVACCEGLLDRLDIKPVDLDAVLLVGGAARMPAVARTVAEAFDRTPHLVAEPELAVVRGAVRFLAHTGSRAVPAETLPEGTAPLAFAVPGGAARLVRWLVEPDRPYPAGAVLARVRLPGGALWDLAASRPGAVERVLVGPGADITTGQWLALARPAAA
jgi:molecular chaperone DnaK (HSP70)